jgi:hypothetical protein
MIRLRLLGQLLQQRLKMVARDNENGLPIYSVKTLIAEMGVPVAAIVAKSNQIQNAAYLLTLRPASGSCFGVDPYAAINFKHVIHPETERKYSMPNLCKEAASIKAQSALILKISLP